MEELEKVQMIKPLGEMPKATVFRQVVVVARVYAPRQRSAA
ncbi:MAG: hypothetical protein U5Q44_12930 [Dehalococcoidia bacterium]|nr:hypothetical protein [Dehalococcoidia bacterium]